MRFPSVSISDLVPSTDCQPFCDRKRLVRCLSRGQIIFGLLSIVCHIATLRSYHDYYFNIIHDAIEKGVAYETKETLGDPIFGSKENRVNLDTGTWRKLEYDARRKPHGTEGHMNTKLRAMIGCISALLFIISGTFGIITSRQETRSHRIIGLIFSFTAFLFCLIFFLPIFIRVTSYYSDEAIKIAEYDQMLNIRRNGLNGMPFKDKVDKMGLDLSQAKFDVDSIVALYSFQILLGMIQAALAVTCSGMVCFSFWSSRNENRNDDSFANRNVCLATISTRSNIAMDEFETLDLPPKYEDVLEANNLPSPKREESKENKEGEDAEVNKDSGDKL